MTDDARRPDDASAPRGRGARIAWLVVVAWLAGTAGAFWQLEGRDLGRFETHAAGEPPVDEAERWLAVHSGVVTAPAPGRVVVVQVQSPGCSCNSYNATHVNRVRAASRRSSIQFVQVMTNDPDAPRFVDVTPAALVYDATGRLAYYGPWSDGAWCGSGAGFVEDILARLDAGHTVRPGPVRAGGCFCPASSAKDTT